MHNYQVYAALKKTKLGKSSGPDGISARIVREFACELSDPLTDIFNQSYKDGVVPQQWKKAIVVPVPKTKPATWNKLRPISLTDHFAKVAEGFVATWLLADIQSKIDPNQYGNRKGVSTSHYLVKLLDTLHKNGDHPSNVSIVVITDFSKAFDCVDHNILINKLIDLGARPSIITWIASFLSSRDQCVRYNGETSDWKTLNGGVPQGTCVGPLAFLALVNDAAKDTEITALKYVDDLTLVGQSNRNNLSVMQSELDNLDEWVNNNNMKLNANKCASMEVTFARSPPIQLPLTINDAPLQQVDTVKILGLQITKDLKWETHIKDILKKANSRLYLMKTLKHFKMPLYDLNTIFKGYVRPITEYAAPAWHPGLTTRESVMLEKIQRRACKIMMGREYLSYENALVQCNLNTLAERREQLCMNFFQSLITSDIFSSWLPPRRKDVHKRNLRNSNKFSLPLCKTKRCQKSPIMYMTKKWNDSH